jgi:hypothetical protein
MSRRPIVSATRPLQLDAAQVAAAVGDGLKVAFTYRRGCRRRIMKGLLKVRGCSCCGIFADITGSQTFRYITFPNIFSTFHTHCHGQHD